MTSPTSTFGAPVMPQVTMVLMCFNQEPYVREAVLSVLSQDYSPLEIIISDDASTDSTAVVARDVVASYAGPHQVQININASNLGIGKHVNQLFRMAKGEMVVLCGGDDISHPTRVSRLVSHWQAQNRLPDAIYCGGRKIDANGKVIGTLNTEIAEWFNDPCHLIEFKHGRRMLAVRACGAYSRRIMSDFGELAPDLSIEDIPLLIRAAMRGGVAYVAEPLVDYRINVSVWRDIRRPGDSFEKRQRHRDFYTLARWRVARQVLQDALVTRQAAFIRSALRAFHLHDFVRVTCETQDMSWRSYFAMALHSGNWRYPLLAGFLDGHPRIHRFLFALKPYVFGNK